MNHYFSITFSYPFSDFMIVWHTSGMMLDITGTYLKCAVAKKRKVTTKHVLDGLSHISVSFFILAPINCSNNSKSLAVILVKLSKRAQLSFGLLQGCSIFYSVFLENLPPSVLDCVLYYVHL
jgi:hypothetical protein